MLQLLIVALAVQLVLAETRTFNFTASFVTANPDGVKDKQMIGFNGQWPLPEIHVDKGDRVQIYLTNGLDDKNTSLHFHGLFMRDTNYMDGPQFVTQCPIQPGDTYLYNFTVPDQAGTFWYHSHTGSQYSDGLRAPFIIHDAPEDIPFKFDEEKVITITDHYHGQYEDVADVFLNRYNPTGAEPIPQNLLLNDTANATIHFDTDKTYFLRFINMGIFVSQYLYIEDHELTIVEVDGVYVEPYKVDYLYMSAAQRYGVLVKSKSTKDKNYAIVQKFDDTMLDVIPEDLRLEQRSYLVYNDEIPLPKKFHKELKKTFNDFNLKPLEKIELLDEPDFRVTLDVVMQNLGDGVNYAFFNNITYVTPKVPTLITALKSGELATNGAIYGSNINGYVLQPNEIVEIVINNKDDGRHPFHLHGHVFQVVAKSKGFEEDPVSYDPEDHDPHPEYPLVRDTVVLEPLGYVVLRFRADNPGVWFFHCHVDWHLEQGLAAVFIEDPIALQKQTPPDDYYENCKAGGIPVEGNAAGNIDYLDLTGEPIQPAPLPEGFTVKGYVAFFISTLVGLYGVWSIIQYGLEDAVQDDQKVFDNLEKILRKHNLLDQVEQSVNERTRL